MDKELNLIIIRGISGAGKSSFAQLLVNNFSCKADYFEADKWMTDQNGNYQFNTANLGFCHDRCKYHVEQAMIFEKSVIILSNTSTSLKEVQYYLDLAAEYGYKVTSVVMEKYHNNKDIHGLNEDTLIRQEKRLRDSIKLR